MTWQKRRKFQPQFVLNFRNWCYTRFLYTENEQSKLIRRLSNFTSPFIPPSDDQVNDVVINKVLFSYQFDFRNNYPTNHALISLTEMIRNALDKGNFACGVFIDLHKAFDTVNYDILLSKLNHYGIRGVTFNWFKSYLSDRTRYTSINNERSEIQNIRYGIPKSSILGPLLFLIHIDEFTTLLMIQIYYMPVVFSKTLTKK